MLTVTDFTEQALVLQTLHELRQDEIHLRTFSDVIDDAGYQYVDLVMEGGGVLGIALVGYVYVLEQMGLRFLQLGGTSAGAINVMLLAAAGPIDAAKAEWTLDKLAAKDLHDFMDGDDDARDLIDTALAGASPLRLALRAIQVIDNLKEDQGLNPGDNFREWIRDLLAQCNVQSMADLRQVRAQTPPGLRHRDTNDAYPPEQFGRVALVAADITTETKAVLPEMGELYWADCDTLNPAELVRASMSIPLFFTPYRVTNVPQGSQAWERWNRLAGYSGDVPSEVVFVDGGVMSNFPIDLFHNYHKVPSAPTFGARIGLSRNKPVNTTKLTQFLFAIFNSARHVHDYDFIARNPDYRNLVGVIDTGEHNWLDFGLSDAAKLDLFARGAQAAGTFLRRFNWQKYKELRAKMVGVY